jgi:methionine synthase II (cobalamin-independent)
VGAYSKVLEIFASKKISVSQVDEVGLSVLIKSCDRLGDAEWAVTILKESIKAGLRVDFSIYQRVFAILVKSPNAAQAAVDMLLNIEKAAIIIKRPSNAFNSNNPNQAVDSLIENLNSQRKEIGLDCESSQEIIDEVRQLKSSIVYYFYY